jgi:hypothetical protein
MIPNDELETPRESRLSAFNEGGGLAESSLNTASTIQNMEVNPMFHASSVLALPNTKNWNVNGESVSTYNQRMPSMAMQKDIAGYGSQNAATP